MKKLIFIILGILILLGAGFLIVSRLTPSQLPVTQVGEVQTPTNIENPSSTQYLAIQIFTGSFDSRALAQSIPPLTKDIASIVDGIISAIGNVGGGNRILGFIPGPLAFDNTDDQIRQLMRDSFAIALQKNIAVGFHIDDSMFWGRLSNLNKVENIEWLDWDKTPNTGRRLDWSSTPTKIMPQLCINSPEVKSEVAKRAVLIGEEVKRGMGTLETAGKANLFLGVIAGWETQIGRDFDTGKYLGYCALTNKGYSAKNPPSDMDEARTDIVKEFIDFWAKSLADAGVPNQKIFSHTAFQAKVNYDMAKFSQPDRVSSSYLETINFTPPRVSFGEHHIAGFSTYPEFGKLEEVQAERLKNGNPPWASTEGTAIDPGVAENGGAGMSMEAYLGDLFNHGAVLVNVFGWEIWDSSNPFRKIAEGSESIEAYQKFLRGEILNESVPVQIPSSQFFPKMQKLQKDLPTYIQKSGPRKVSALYDSLNQALKAQHYTDAEKNIDEILKIVEQEL